MRLDVHLSYLRTKNSGRMQKGLMMAQMWGLDRRGSFMTSYYISLYIA